MSNDVTMLGFAYHRYKPPQPFGIRQADRQMHLLAFGQTGSGKSTTLLHMALSDAVAGRGLCLIDPHGDLARAVSKSCSQEHTYWSVADPASDIGYNPLTHVSRALRPLVCSGLIETLKHQWRDAWGARMEHLLRHAILALLDLPQTDKRDIVRLFVDREFRRSVVPAIYDPQVRQFWTQEFPALPYATAMDGVPPIANKLGAFLAHPQVRRALCEPKQPLRLRQIMDDDGILIVDLAKGKLGADNANLVGGLVLSSLANAAYTRSELPAFDRRPFALYVDEIGSFAGDAFADMAAEVRKYAVSLTLTAQTTHQIRPAVLSALLGNVGSLMCFRVGVEDAPKLARQLQDVSPDQLITLPNHRAFLRLMVDGTQTPAFSVSTIQPRAP